MAAGNHKMLMTDGDGWLAETVRHSGVAARSVVCASGGDGYFGMVTDGFDGRLTDGSARLCGSVNGWNGSLIFADG